MKNVSSLTDGDTAPTRLDETKKPILGQRDFNESDDISEPSFHKDGMTDLAALVILWKKIPPFTREEILRIALVASRECKT